MMEQAEDGFLVGQENDLEGLHWLAKFGFLRAKDVGVLLWGQEENSFKYGQRICRKWIDKGYVLKRELPSKAGGAFVLAAGGVKFLSENGINSKTGKDWGSIKNGEWSPPREWKHHVIANSFLCYLESRVTAIIPENQFRKSGSKGKLPDGMFINNDEAFWIEVENHRKSGSKMEDLCKIIIDLKTKKSEYKGNKIFPVIVYPENSVDERGYAINHKERIINAIKSISKVDLYLKFICVKLIGLTVDSHKEEAVLIESDKLSIELKRLNKTSRDEKEDSSIYYIGNEKFLINKKDFSVLYKGRKIQCSSITEARRLAAKCSILNI
jgi:hypothetical protein